jgi:hypothetical protein
MNEFSQLVDFVTHTSSGLSGFGAIAILFFLWREGLINFGNKKNENGIPTWAQELTMHFNEETTSILKEIRDGIEKLDNRGEKLCKKTDDILDALSEIDKYGVKFRKE